MKEGWKVKTIGDVAKIVAGGTPKTKIKEYWGGEIAWITPADLGKLNTREVSLTRRTISAEGLQKSSAKLFPAHSVILSSRAPIGHLAINTVPMSTNQGCRGIVPKDNLDTIFLYYFLKGNITLLNELGTGATFKELSTKALSSVSIPIPPLSEQQQIVTILDQAFESIDQAKTNIEKNIENAKELFDSKKEGIFESLTIKNSPKPIIEACEKIFAGGDAPKDNFSKEKTDTLSIPIIANAVKNNGLYGFTNKARVTKPSITVAARGSGTGHTEFRDYPFVPIVRLIVLTPNTERINVEFLMYAIKNLTIMRSGSAIPQLTVPMIKGYSIPMPDLTIQSQIVESLNKLEKQLVDYKSRLNQKLLELDELKKSILQKAFAGELTNKTVLV
jgi:type I restriction enzyme S subunit